MSFAVAVSSELQGVSIAFGTPYPEVAKTEEVELQHLCVNFCLTTSWKISQNSSQFDVQSNHVEFKNHELSDPTPAAHFFLKHTGKSNKT